MNYNTTNIAAAAILPMIDNVLSMTGTMITYSSAASVYIFMMLIFLGHSLIIASTRAALWTMAACIAVRYDYLVIRAVNAAGNHSGMSSPSSNMNEEWSLQWSLFMLTPFVIMLYPCWQMTRVPRPWLLVHERALMWLPWFTLLIATAMRSWTVMELALVAQFTWARYSVNNKQEWFHRSVHHSFAPRLLTKPPGVEQSLTSDVVTSSTTITSLSTYCCWLS
jgi:hypothetical protein